MRLKAWFTAQEPKPEPKFLSAFDVEIGDGLADAGEAVVGWVLSTGYVDEPREQ